MKAIIIFLLPSISYSIFTPRKLTVDEVKEEGAVQLEALFSSVDQQPQPQSLATSTKLKHLPKGTNMAKGPADSIR